MKQILIAHRAQFGYHIDTYMWCKYLRNDYSISVICFDGNRPKIYLENVNVIYVSDSGSKIIRGIRYMLHVLMAIMRHRGMIIVSSFPECGFFKRILPFRKMVLDIRSLSVCENQNIREKADRKILKNSKLYDYVITISDGLKQLLNIDNCKSAVMPLGAEIESKSIKDYEVLKLLYIGTFANRDLHKTIIGLSLALKQLPSTCSIEYYIIGKGFNNEEQEMKQLCKKEGISSLVHFLGYIPHNQLRAYFEKCNIGVSFIPIKSYYEYQPPTKTFEYCLSGLYTIGTNTFSNREVLNNNNGILIDDSPNDFARAIVEIYNKRNLIKSNLVRESMLEYTWENLVNNKLKPILKDIENKFNLI